MHTKIQISKVVKMTLSAFLLVQVKICSIETPYYCCSTIEAHQH